MTPVYKVIPTPEERIARLELQVAQLKQELFDLKYTITMQTKQYVLRTDVVPGQTFNGPCQTNNNQ